MPGIECPPGTSRIAKQIPGINRPLPPRVSSLVILSMFFLAEKIRLRSWAERELDAIHGHLFSIFNNNSIIFFHLG